MKIQPGSHPSHSLSGQIRTVTGKCIMMEKIVCRVL